jgi:hypothetical protein
MPDRAMITDVEDYFARGCGRCDRFATPDCSTRLWLSGLRTLRRIAHEAGLTETAKWGHPVYMHAGRNIAIIGAFRGDFRLTFFNAALLQDPERLLDRQGPNTRHPDCLRFTDNQLDPRIPGSRNPCSFAQAMAVSYPASACRQTPEAGSFHNTRSSRFAASGVPSARITTPHAG